MEKINEIYFKCLKCGKKIYKENKYIHKIKCDKKNEISEEFICYICGTTMDIRFKDDHLLAHDFEKEKEENILNMGFKNDEELFDNKDEDKNKIKIKDGPIFSFSSGSSQNSDNESNSSNEENYNDNYNNNYNGNNNDNYNDNYNGNYNDNYNDNYNIIDDTYSHNNGLDEEIIQNYPITKIKNIKKLADNKKKCLICLENFKTGDNSIILNCMHIFHSECAKNWMKYKGFCPLCKIKIKTK